MTRRFLPVLVLIFSSTLFMPKVEAHGPGYGYAVGYGNWCGWDFYPNYWGGGETVQGSILRGMGSYLRGAGEYNLLSAQANAVNTQTWMTLNEYLYQSQREAAHRYSQRMAARKAKGNASAQKHYLQLRDKPTQLDIQNASAINLKVALLTNAEYADKVYEALKVDLTPEFIDQLPLSKSEYGVSISLAELRKGIVWPEGLKIDEYQADRQAIEKALAVIVANNYREANSPVASKDLAAAVEALQNHLTENKKTLTEGALFAGRLNRLARALTAGGYGEALQSIAALNPKTLGGLLREMKAQGLRFGASQNPAESTANEKLFTVLKAAPTLLDKVTLAGLAEVMANSHP